MQGNAERKIETLGNLVYNIGKERFGIVEARTSRDTQKGNNRRETRIKKCREELRQLNKQFKRSSEVEKMGIAVLTDDIRSELGRLRRAERSRKLKKQQEAQGP